MLLQALILQLSAFGGSGAIGVSLHPGAFMFTDHMSPEPFSSLGSRPRRTSCASSPPAAKLGTFGLLKRLVLLLVWVRF